MNSLAVIGICVAVAVIAAAAAGIFIFIRSRRKHDEGTGTGTAVSTSPSGLSDTPGDAGTESEPAAGPAPSEAGFPSAVEDHATAETSVGSSAGSETGGKRDEPESKQSRLVRLRARLAKTSNPFGRALFTILSQDTLTKSDWDDVEDTLILADVGAETSEQLVNELRTDASRGRKTLRQSMRCSAPSCWKWSIPALTVPSLLNGTATQTGRRQ